VPLEISEISITMHVSDGPAGVRVSDASTSDDHAGDLTGGRDALIQECVQRVLDILRAERER